MEAKQFHHREHVEPRFYSCRRCGYKMRFGTTRCSDCWEKAPIYNHKAFWRLLSVLCGAVALATICITVLLL